MRELEPSKGLVAQIQNSLWGEGGISSEGAGSQLGRVCGREGSQRLALSPAGLVRLLLELPGWLWGYRTGWPRSECSCFTRGFVSPSPRRQKKTSPHRKNRHISLSA